MVAIAAVGCGGDDGSADPVADAAPIGPDAFYPSSIECSTDLAPVGDVALPKNIIFIMGDGMGPVQVQAGGIHTGAPLALESLSAPHYYNTDSISTDAAADPNSTPTDSAAAATAMATGTRTVNDAVGVDATGAELTTIADLSAAAGKAIGIVTNSYVYDASPAAFYAHVPDRDEYAGILDQLVGNAQPDVVLGGGRPIFEGVYMTAATEAGYAVVLDDAELAAWDPATAPKLLGLFESDAVSIVPSLYEWFTTPVSLRTNLSTDPRLPVMVERALDGLEGDADGLFLFIENEHIDTLGHIALLERTLVPEALPVEVAELDAAVAVAIAWIEQNSSFDDTLLIVAADHETGGYELTDGALDDPLFWASPEHSRTPVAVYARGPGADRISAICRGADLFYLMTGQLPAQ